MSSAEQIAQHAVHDGVCRRVEEASINAWPAMQQLLLDGWLLRFSQGFTKRANSVIPLYHGDLPVSEKVQFCENAYARERLRCTFRLTSIGGHGSLDELLAARGFRLLEATEVLSRPLDTDLAPAPGLTLVNSARWLDVYGSLTGMPEPARAMHRAILHGIPLPCAYGVIGSVDAPLACGLAVLEGDLVGLFDVVTHPGARRAGHGTELVSGLLAWAAAQGARRAYLQMVADNHPARGLYQTLGFDALYRYWYRMVD